MARSPRSGRSSLVFAALIASIALIVACGGGGDPGVDAPDVGPSACYLPGNVGTSAPNDTDCCAGLQCKAGACCRAAGALCAGDGECCNGQCVGGGCVCAKPGESCFDDYDCCDGESCVAKADGAQCKATADCNAISQCRDKRCCREGGSTCDVAMDCCTGSCTGGRCDCVP